MDILVKINKGIYYPRNIAIIFSLPGGNGEK
jgi:hypothetical protein